MKKPIVIVIAGPTASGKTSLSVEVAKKIEGEILSADSMQIYQDMDIGTAKITEEEMQGIPHHMISFVKPDKRFSVADFQKEAMNIIHDIVKRGKTPVVVGGTGLYIDALIYETEFHEEKTNLDYRNFLEQRVEKEGLETLAQEAETIDHEAMKKISHNDKKRILRILEIYNQTGKTKTQLDKESRQKEKKYQYIVFAIDLPRDILYERINKRVDTMLQQGLIQEVENLKQKYHTFPTAMQGLGYKEVVEYLNKEITQEEMMEKIKQETRRYAKRQLTWFRKNKEIIWLDGLRKQEDNVNIICEKIKKEGMMDRGGQQ